MTRSASPRTPWGYTLFLFTRPLFALFLFSLTLFMLPPVASAQAPTISDLYDGEAYFGDERRVCGDASPVHPLLDFHLWLHFSGMAVIEWPENSGVVYYFAEHWEGEPTTLSPHLYKSVDGGATFTHVTKLFDVTDRDVGTCNCGTPGSTTACWKALFGKDWCIDQMREPDVMRLGNHFYVAYEAAAQENGGPGAVMGPAIVRLPDLSTITQPVPIDFNPFTGSFRQHPPFVVGYDANPSVPGLQTISASTPVWVEWSSSPHLFWTGTYPNNQVNWQQMDIYRGHFSSSPGGPADCTLDPIRCFFTYDEFLVTSPNLGPGAPGKFDETFVDVRGIIEEGGYYYMIYNGGPDLEWPHLGIARSTDLKNWTRKYLGDEAPIFRNPAPGSSFGKIVKISGEYWLYFLNHRPPGIANGSGPEWVSRLYRRKLKWNWEQNRPIFCSCYGQEPCNF